MPATGDDVRTKTRGGRAATCCAGLLSLAVACQSSTGELSGLAQLPPLDYSVLVTGGAFLQPAPPGERGTFAGATSGAEAVPIGEVLALLREGAVFQRVAADPDEQHRHRLLRQLDAPGDN